MQYRIDVDIHDDDAARAAKDRFEKLTWIWCSAATLALFAGIYLYATQWQSRFDHADLKGLEIARTSRGPVFVATEKVKGMSRYGTLRTSWIDARTLTRLGRSIDADAAQYLGQGRGGGPLWFAQRGRSGFYPPFTAWDPVSLREIYSSDTLEARHLPALESGLHSFSFDKQRGAIALVDNLNHTLLLDSSFELRSEAEYDALPFLPEPGPQPPPPRKGRLPQPLPSLELLATGDVKLFDGETGLPTALTEPQGLLLSARDSLASDAPVSLVRIDDQGQLVWRRSFPGNLSVPRVYVLGDALIAVTRSTDGDENDWLHALDARTGAERSRYQF